MRQRLVGTVVVIIASAISLYALTQYFLNTPAKQAQNMQISLNFANSSTIRVNLYNAGEESFRFKEVGVNSVSTRFNEDVGISKMDSGQILNLTFSHYWRPDIEYTLTVRGVYGNQTSYSTLTYKTFSPREYPYVVIIQRIRLFGRQRVDDLGVVQYEVQDNSTLSVFNNSTETYRVEEICFAYESHSISGIDRRLEPNQTIEVTINGWVSEVYIRATRCDNANITTFSDVFPDSKIEKTLTVARL